MNKKTGKISYLLTVLVLSLLLIHNMLTAFENKSDSIDPKAGQVIKKALNYLSGLSSFRTEIDMNIKIEAQGMKQEMAVKYSIALQRPNKLAMILKSGMLGSTVVCDGKDVYSYVPMTKKYTKEKAPESLNDLKLPAGIGGTEAIIEYFIRDNSYDKLMSEVKGVEYIGFEEMNGMTYDHLKLLTDEADLNIWVKEGEKPLTHKIVPDLTKSIEKEAAQQAQLKNMKAEMEIVFKNWEVNIQIPDDTFIYTPPEDTKLTESPGSHPLLAKPAPSFKLQLLDGGEFDLSQQKDKKIVILDFWATWCGPCVRVMPIMEEVANEYKDKGVILIAVNLRESPQDIRSFLQEQGLHPIVALDKDGAVGNVYKAQAIPQTVIIGKEGIVQAVHVGALPNLKEILKKELNDLLAGKKLTSIKKQN